MNFKGKLNAEILKPYCDLFGHCGSLYQYRQGVRLSYLHLYRIDPEVWVSPDLVKQSLQVVFEHESQRDPEVFFEGREPDSLPAHHFVFTAPEEMLYKSHFIVDGDIESFEVEKRQLHLFGPNHFEIGVRIKNILSVQFREFTASLSVPDYIQLHKQNALSIFENDW